MTPSRREFLTVASAAALAGAATASRVQTEAGKRHNIVLFVTDDQSDAGCFGNSVVRTPALDALASEGTRFTHAFCTTPSCSPSRSVILTGKHNHTTGQYGLAHPYHHFVSFEEQPTLPGYLRDAGYRTIQAGKFHVQPRETFAFEEYLNSEYRDGLDSVQMGEAVAPLLEKADDRPFFLYFNTTEPHRPFKRTYADAVDPATVEVPPFLPDTDATRQELAEYYMSCQQADMALGKLIESLKSTGHYENTLIIWIADNGLPFPGAKTHLYEPGVRLPCVIRHPEQENRGGMCDAMISWTDITPTVLEFAGVSPKKPEFHGRSFLQAIGQEHLDGRDEVYFSHTFHEVTMYYPMRGYRDRRYKFIWNIAHQLPYPFARDLFGSRTWQDVLESGASTYGGRSLEAFVQRPRYELYDLEQDPWEFHNLAAAPEHEERLRGYIAKIQEFQKSTQDPWEIKWTHE